MLSIKVVFTSDKVRLYVYIYHLLYLILSSLRAESDFIFLCLASVASSTVLYHQWNIGHIIRLMNKNYQLWNLLPHQSEDVISFIKNLNIKGNMKRQHLAQDCPGFKSWFFHILAECPSGSCLNSFSFFFYKEKL